MTMKKTLFALFLFFMTIFIQSSAAVDQKLDNVAVCHFLRMEPTPYVLIKGGFTGGYEVKCLRIFTNLGYYAGVAAGYKLFRLFRVEGEAIYQYATVHSPQHLPIKVKHIRGHVGLASFMANALLDFHCEFPLRPYIGGGLGFACASGHWKGELRKTNLVNTNIFIETRTKESFHKNGFAWQFIAGLRYLLCENSEVSLDYRFLKMENKLSNHSLGVSFIRLF